jgi:hypothetical protein
MGLREEVREAKRCGLQIDAQHTVLKLLHKKNDVAFAQH